MARKRRRLHRRYKRNRSEGGTRPRSNPPMAMELVEFIGPGFAGFAATRVMTRIATVQIAQRKPSWAKHAGVIASLLAFGAAWWGAHKVKFLERYAMPITVGAGIAAAQSVLQLWLPKLGWIVSDASPQLAAGSASQNSLMVDPTIDQITSRMEPVDEDPSSFAYDESYEADNYAQTAKPAAGGPPRTAAAKKAAAEEDLLADLNLDEGMGGGVFAN